MIKKLLPVLMARCTIEEGYFSQAFMVFTLPPIAKIQEPEPELHLAALWKGLGRMQRPKLATSWDTSSGASLREENLSNCSSPK
jgi:hypothetical protein